MEEVKDEKEVKEEKQMTVHDLEHYYPGNLQSLALEEEPTPTEDYEREVREMDNLQKRMRMKIGLGPEVLAKFEKGLEDGTIGDKIDTKCATVWKKMELKRQNQVSQKVPETVVPVEEQDQEDDDSLDSPQVDVDDDDEIDDDKDSNTSTVSTKSAHIS